MSDKPLPNPRHERFAQALAERKSADEAYVLAGFKANRGNASRLKANENVQARVDAILRKSAERVEIDRAWIIERLAKNAERSMQTRIDGGLELPGPLYNVAASNRALELLGKDLRMFRDAIELTGKDGAAIQVEQQISEEARSAYDFARRIAWLLAQGKLALSGPQDD